MTDYPRFQPVQSEPVDGGYHGAPLVNIVFRLVDRWLERRSLGDATLAVISVFNTACCAVVLVLAAYKRAVTPQLVIAP